MSTVETFFAWLLFVALIALAAVLTVLVPRADRHGVTIDVRCASGNPVVGVWVDAIVGGDGWAKRASAGSRFTRFTHDLPYRGLYTVHAGCGGSADRWALSMRSEATGQVFRRLSCDDIDVAPPTPGTCIDE